MMKLEYLDSQITKNLNYLYSLGDILMIRLITLIVTGITLVMHYKPDDDLAFQSVEHIMRNVEGGWILHYVHMNMARFFFISGIYYGSYKELVSYFGVFGIVIFFLMMATAFLGYVFLLLQMGYCEQLLLQTSPAIYHLLDDGASNDIVSEAKAVTAFLH